MRTIWLIILTSLPQTALASIDSIQIAVTDLKPKAAMIRFSLDTIETNLNAKGNWQGTMEVYRGKILTEAAANYDANPQGKRSEYLEKANEKFEANRNKWQAINKS